MLDRFLHAFLRVERTTTRFALWVAVVLLIGSVSLGFYQVVTRFALDAPSTWSEVGARSLMIWCVFMAAAPGFRAGSMMSVEVVYQVVPERLHKALETVIAALCAVFLVVVLWFGAAMTWRVRTQMLAGLDVSIAWAYAALPVGCAFSLLAVVARWVEVGLKRERLVLVDAEEPLPHGRRA